MFAAAADPFADLNSAQRQAVDHDGGPLLILAGAGTGKTTTLAARVARLVAGGTDPGRIMLLTFTRRAAAEMGSRAARRVAQAGGAGLTGQVVSGTFHGVANRLLRRYADRIGLTTDFGLLDAADAADLMDLIREDQGAATGNSRFPRKATLAAIYTRVINARMPLQDTLDQHFGWCAENRESIGRVFTGYSQRKRAQNLLDYDDLLLFWKVLASAPGIGDELAAAFDHLLVDEYQDTNALQAEIVQALRRDNDNVTVVGDDAQAIYGFRAADVGHILSFPDHFAGTTVIRLERSYRSTQPILDTANAVVAEMPQVHDRPKFCKSLFSDRISGPHPNLHTCHDEVDQSDRVCRAVLERREQGTPLQQQAVLFRTGHHSAHLELELSRRNIPYVKFGGLKYLESAHVKDLVSLLRILDNTQDTLAWFRILQRLEGVGPARAKRIIHALDTTSAGQALGTLPTDLDLPPVVAEGLQSLSEALAQSGRAPCVGAQIQRLREWYAPVCTRSFDDHLARMADLEQLEVLTATSPLTWPPADQKRLRRREGCSTSPSPDHVANWTSMCRCATTTSASGPGIATATGRSHGSCKGPSATP